MSRSELQFDPTQTQMDNDLSRSEAQLVPLYRHLNNSISKGTSNAIARVDTSAQRDEYGQYQIIPLMKQLNRDCVRIVREYELELALKKEPSCMPTNYDGTSESGITAEETKRRSNLLIRNPSAVYRASISYRLGFRFGDPHTFLFEIDAGWNT
ncbi:hypothetical protein HYALB_00004488 [Hymenoscyphus albidus]|uniref:Uncharacterized protein n=1 Tax=Hymenoscyphus albidus TaxID=595503 RepID=A0A9N9M1B4_9HELO|nr:hypothetical protein HYALB_00004488 [Hymenoscyphus albidus]